MSIAIVKVKPFRLPNFLRIVGCNHTLGVGDCLPTDEDAGRFWDEMRDSWIAHVRKKRAVTGFAGDTTEGDAK